MATENTTTLSSAVAVADTNIVVASATGLAVDLYLLVDQEVMKITKAYNGTSTTVPVLRGLDGTAAVAHPKSANVTSFATLDQMNEGAVSPQAFTQYPNAARGRRLLSYSANGAITMPSPGEDMVAVLNGTSALAMTLANPTKDMDGCFLYIIANGKAAHTVTYSAGVGNGGSSMDVGTFATTEATGCALIACNGFWNLWANGIGSSGTQVAGVVWA